RVPERATYIREEATPSPMEGRREIRFIGIYSLHPLRTKKKKNPDYAVYRVAVPQSVVRSWTFQLGKLPEKVLITFDGWTLRIEPYVEKTPEERLEEILAAASSREKKVSSGG
ncbi:MAG: hypothetical protein LM580_10370, partial [Thermofilum sp.]|nr:hypothetical protein [Thermofilum sp.]